MRSICDPMVLSIVAMTLAFNHGVQSWRSLLEFDREFDPGVRSWTSFLDFVPGVQYHFIFLFAIFAHVIF